MSCTCSRTAHVMVARDYASSTPGSDAALLDAVNGLLADMCPHLEREEREMMPVVSADDHERRVAGVGGRLQQGQVQQASCRRGPLAHRQPRPPTAATSWSTWSPPYSGSSSSTSSAAPTGRKRTLLWAGTRRRGPIAPFRSRWRASTRGGPRGNRGPASVGRMRSAHTVEQVRAAEAELMAGCRTGRSCSGRPRGWRTRCSRCWVGRTARTYSSSSGSGTTAGMRCTPGRCWPGGGAGERMAAVGEPHGAGLAALTEPAGARSPRRPGTPPDLVVDGIVGIGGRPGLGPRPSKRSRPWPASRSWRSTYRRRRRGHR